MLSLDQRRFPLITYKFRRRIVENICVHNIPSGDLEEVSGSVQQASYKVQPPDFAILPRTLLKVSSLRLRYDAI